MGTYRDCADKAPPFPLFEGALFAAVLALIALKQEPRCKPLNGGNRRIEVARRRRSIAFARPKRFAEGRAHQGRIVLIDAAVAVALVRVGRLAAIVFVVVDTVAVTVLSDE